MTFPGKRGLQRRNCFPRNSETWSQFYARLAQVGTHPKGGDAKQAPPPLSDAVDVVDAPEPSPPSSTQTACLAPQAVADEDQRGKDSMR